MNNLVIETFRPTKVQNHNADIEPVNEQSLQNVELIIHRYKKTVVEFFEKIVELQNPIISNSLNIIYIGLTTIIHIFRILICKYKNIDIAYHYSTQGYLYYLEYIQQILTTNLHHNLDCNDAVLFVYSKTLSNTELNKINFCQNMNLDDIKPILDNLAIISNILLVWNIEIELKIRIELIKLFLTKFLLLSIDHNIPDLYRFYKINTTINNSNHILLFHKFYKSIGQFDGHN